MSWKVGYESSVEDLVINVSVGVLLEVVVCQSNWLFQTCRAVVGEVEEVEEEAE